LENANRADREQILALLENVDAVKSRLAEHMVRTRPNRDKLRAALVQELTRSDGKA
jgi:hypothetical protein